MPANEPVSREDMVLCPSSPAHPDAAVIGVVAGRAGAPRVVPTKQPMRVTPEIIEMALPANPSEVFRFASPCQTSACIHFRDASCQIAARGVMLLDEVVPRLPACAIRRQCRWFRQEGPAMCRRCPQIVTEQHAPSADMLRVVDETGPPGTVAASVAPGAPPPGQEGVDPGPL